MCFADAFFGCRVFRPSGLPHGLVGGRPPELLPSPPPSGWSTGFMATPRTLGRLPSHRLLPALPTESSSCSELPTSPIVARQRPCTSRISVERRRSVTYSPSLATTWALEPAVRASWPPFPILSSMLCTFVPNGISPSGTALPVRVSDPGPETTVSPCARPLGWRMYRFSPSAYTIRAIRAVRLGSYSISATFPGIPNLFRLKSIFRYWRLWPPPLWREVRWPWLLRPPLPRFGSSSDFSGVERVTSSNPEMERNRAPAVIGRNCLMLISALEHGDGIAFLERNDRLLPPGGGAPGPAPRHLVPAHLHGAHVGDGDAKELLQRIPDLILIGLRMHLEGVFLSCLVGGRAFLGHHGPDHDLVQRWHLLGSLLFRCRFLRWLRGTLLRGGLLCGLGLGLRCRFGSGRLLLRSGRFNPFSPAHSLGLFGLGLLRQRLRQDPL